MSSPEFWSKIWVRIICNEPFDSIPTRGLSQLNLATLWMNRANGYPLSISLVTKCVDETSQNLMYGEICRVILPIISTVRTLHIDSLPHTPFGQTPACRFDVASQLQDLHLCTARLLYPIQSFSSPPCIRRAAINVFNDDPTLISLPWASLTDLDIGGTGVEAEKCRNILRQCNNLKAGKFLIRTRRPIYPPKGPKVTLPLLERFIVYFDGQYDTSYFSDIELPSLSLFHIGTELAEIEWLTNSPLSIDYNGLQSLTLARVDISLDSLLCILHSAPTIHHLALNFYRTNAETFLRTLQYEDNSASTFLPRLRSLVLYTEHLVLSEKPYVDAILSRWHVPDDARIARLQRVTLLFLDFGWIESSLRSQFVQSQSEGLDITIEESFMGFIFPPYATWDSFSPKPTS